MLRARPGRAKTASAFTPIANQSEEHVARAKWSGRNEKGVSTPRVETSRRKKILPRGFEPRTTACLSAAKRAVHRGNVPLDLYKHRVINQLDDGRRSSKPAAILLSSVGHRMTASSRGALSAHERPSRLTLAHGLRMRPPVLSRYAAPAWKEAHARSSVCDPAASSRRCLVLRRSGRLS